MDFSDIRTIIIGEAGEYGKRLVRYLEIHLSSAVRLYHFTSRATLWISAQVLIWNQQARLKHSS